MVKFKRPSKEDSKGALRYHNKHAKALLVDRRREFTEKKFRNRNREVKPFRKDLILRGEGDE